jgi:hypothetical protein
MTYYFELLINICHIDCDCTNFGNEVHDERNDEVESNSNLRICMHAQSKFESSLSI